MSIKPNFYGFIYSLAFLVFYYYIQKSNLKKKDFYFFISLFLSILFARFFHILDLNNLFYYLNNPIKIIEIWKGGLAWFGGVFGFLLAQIIYLKIVGKEEKKKLLKLLNNTILFLPIFIMLGRIANYFNQENLGVGFLGLPQQIFEALSQGLIVFLIVLFSKDRIKAFIIYYAILRTFTEFFRYPYGIKWNHFIIFSITLTILFVYKNMINKNKSLFIF
jgi:phosphatidylglycerol:prolipoprotein diacylglycerol transferase